MISILKGFLPWILYSILYGPSPAQFRLALIVAIACSLFLDRAELKKGFLLTWCTLIYFLGLLVYTSLHEAIWLKQHMWLISNLALACIALGSAAIQKPFTMQYAKEKTEPQYWNTPLFIEINYILTLLWGVIFIFSAFTNYLHISHWHLNGTTYFILNNIGWVIGAYLSKVFPEYWKKYRGNKQNNK